MAIRRLACVVTLAMAVVLVQRPAAAASITLDVTETSVSMTWSAFDAGLGMFCNGTLAADGACGTVTDTPPGIFDFLGIYFAASSAPITTTRIGLLIPGDASPARSFEVTAGDCACDDHFSFIDGLYSDDVTSLDYVIALTSSYQELGTLLELPSNLSLQIRFDGGQTAVPEPGSLLLLGTGLVVVLLRARRA